MQVRLIQEHAPPEALGGGQEPCRDHTPARVTCKGTGGAQREAGGSKPCPIPKDLEPHGPQEAEAAYRAGRHQEVRPGQETRLCLKLVPPAEP